MKTFKIKLPRKTVFFHIGFTTEPNQETFEDDVKAYFNSRYPRMKFDDQKDFVFDYTVNCKIPEVRVQRLSGRKSTTISRFMFKDLNIISRLCGYETVKIIFAV